MREAADVEVRKAVAHATRTVSEIAGNPVLVRPWTKGDVPWITNSWLKNYQGKGPVTKRVNGRIYADAHHRMMEHVLPRASVLVACHPESTSVNFGWICAEVFDQGDGPLLAIHYVYVKDRFTARRTKAEKLPDNPDGSRPERSAYSGGQGIGRLLLRTIAEPERDCVGVRHTHETSRGAGWLKRMHADGEIPHASMHDPFLLFGSLPRGWY